MWEITGPPGVSVSHGRTYDLVAPGAGDPGVDPEVRRPCLDPEALARRVFAGKGLRRVLREEGKERMRFFYRYRTLKEALLRAWTRGPPCFPRTSICRGRWWRARPVEVLSLTIVPGSGGCCRIRGRVASPLWPGGTPPERPRECSRASSDSRDRPTTWIRDPSIRPTMNSPPSRMAQVPALSRGSMVTGERDRKDTRVVSCRNKNPYGPATGSGEESPAPTRSPLTVSGTFRNLGSPDITIVPSPSITYMTGMPCTL